jgi:ribose 1,5-bisphosphokinase
MIERGTLALIVGPSGVGKDSLIAHARIMLGDDSLFCFPSRVITRPAAGGVENHVALSAREFDTAEAHGAFLLSWRAHDTAYGIPKSVVEALECNCIVVANVSRTVIAAAEARVRSTFVISVSASRELLQHRLATRGREPSVGIEQRLERALSLPPTRAPIIEVDNSGSLEVAARRFIDVLRGLTPARGDSVR